MQIYQPPMGYHFLKRPYELVPLAAEDFPGVASRFAILRCPTPPAA